MSIATVFNMSIATVFSMSIATVFSMSIATVFDMSIEKVFMMSIKNRPVFKKFNTASKENIKAIYSIAIIKNFVKETPKLGCPQIRDINNYVELFVECLLTL